MREVEDTYWWYSVLRGTVSRACTAALKGTPEARILDAGCGTGGMMKVLREKCPTWCLSGLDFSPHAVAHTRKRGFQDVRQGSVDDLPYESASFNLLYSLDVLYVGQVNEVKALAEFFRVLRPGAKIFLNLPAFDLLRGQHDVAVHGTRRYRPGRVKELLQDAGFEVERSHCWNLWLFLPVFTWRLASRLSSPSDVSQAKSDLSMPSGPVNRLLSTLGRWDAGVCDLLRSPLGTSVWAVARKPLKSQA